MTGNVSGEHEKRINMATENLTSWIQGIFSTGLIAIHILNFFSDS